MDRNFDLKNIILLSGFYCASYVGSAFASGREMLQFFTAFGIKGYIGLGIMSAIYFMFGLVIMNTSRKAKLGDDPYALFTHMCGKNAGKIFVWLMTVQLMCCMILLNSGAGANLTETLGAPGIVGRCLVIVSALTVCLGLNRIVDILSRIGPAIAVIMVLIAILAIVKSPHGLLESSSLVSSLDIYSGGSNWLTAALKYSANCMFSMIPVLYICGTRVKGKGETALLSASQVIVLSIMVALTTTSLLMNIGEIYSYQIPNLMLLKLYAPGLRIIFSIILMVCTYSGLTITLWTVIRKFTKEGTRFYYILTILIAIAVIILSGTMPFSNILNMVMSVGMYCGIVFMVCALIHLFLSFRLSDSVSNEEE